MQSIPHMSLLTRPLPSLRTLAVSALLLGAAPFSQAFVVEPDFATHYTIFTAEPGNFEDRPVGYADLRYDFPTLGDGSYAWNELVNPSLTIEFFLETDVIFTIDDLVTPIEFVFVEIRGDYFFFSTTEESTSPFGGSADFSDGTYYFATEPYVAGIGGVESGLTDTPLYILGLIGDPGEPLLEGSYGVPSAVPEPATVGAALGLLALLGVARRRALRAKAA